MSRWFEKCLAWSQVIVLKQDYCVRFPCQFQVCHSYKYNYWSEMSDLWRSDVAGVLACLDGYMNIALEQTEEYVNGQLKNKYGDAFIRGNNGKGTETISLTLAVSYLLTCHWLNMSSNQSLTKYKKSMYWFCVFKTCMFWSLIYIFM